MSEYCVKREWMAFVTWREAPFSCNSAFRKIAEVVSGSSVQNLIMINSSYWFTLKVKWTYYTAHLHNTPDHYISLYSSWCSVSVRFSGTQCRVFWVFASPETSNTHLSEKSIRCKKQESDTILWIHYCKRANPWAYTSFCTVGSGLLLSLRYMLTSFSKMFWWMEWEVPKSGTGFCNGPFCMRLQIRIVFCSAGSRTGVPFH